MGSRKLLRLLGLTIGLFLLAVIPAAGSGQDTVDLEVADTAWCYPGSCNLPEVDYPDVDAQVTYNVCDDSLTGSIVASGMLASRQYQLKLEGNPTCQYGATGNDAANQALGSVGRWWCKSCTPEQNVSDAWVAAHPEACVLGYLLFDCTSSDADGNLSFDFDVDYSWHVCGTPQRGDISMPDGDYDVSFLVTEAGDPWRTVLISRDVHFTVDHDDGDSDGVPDACDPVCDMRIEIPEEIQGIAEVEISGLPGRFEDSDTVELPTCTTTSWRLWLNGKVSGWKTKHVDCQPLVVEPGDYCWMHIEVPEDIRGIAEIEISGLPGRFHHCDHVYLPQSIDISWRLWLNGKVSGWKTKHVDCDPLVVQPGDYCWMHIEVPEDIREIAEIEISGLPGRFQHCDHVYMPQSINISWRLWLNGKVSGWKTKHVDCNPLVVEPADYCWMHIEVPEDIREIAEVEISGLPGRFHHCDHVYLPQSINISWRLWLNGKVSGWKTKPVDCSPLAVAPGDYCWMHIEVPEEIREIAEVEISGLPGRFHHCDHVYLPTSINISWRLWLNGKVSGWKTKPVDCDPLVVQPGDYCPMGIVVADRMRKDAKVNISGVGTFVHGDTVHLPTSINISWRLEVNGVVCGWYTKHVDCTLLEVDPKGTVKIPEGLAQAGAKVNIRYDSPNKDYGDGDEFDYVPGKEFQWQLKVNGFSSAWKKATLGCDGILEVTEADYCLMAIDMPDGLAAAGAKVNIRYDRPNTDYGDGESVYLPKCINIQWQLKVSGFSSAWKEKHVDCNPLVVDGEDYCLMTIDMPDGLAAAGAKVNIRYDRPNTDYGDGESVYLPKCITIQWQLKVSGFSSAWKQKHVDCNPLVVDGEDYCLMTIDMPDGLAAAGAKVNIRYDSPNKDYGNGESVYLPKSITIQWQLKVSGFSSAWKQKHVDCNPLVVGDDDYCLMAIDMPDDLAAAGAKVNIRYDRPNTDYGDGASVYLPKCITIQWQLKVSGFSSAWKQKHVDCNPLVVDSADYCHMEIQMRDDVTRAGGKVNIRYDSPNRDYDDGDAVYLPKGINVQWQLKVSKMTCGWYSKPVDCSALVVAPQATVQMPDDLAAAGAKVNIAYDNPNKDYANGDQFDYVPGKDFQWQLKVSGFSGPMKTRTLGCDGILEVTDADYCKMQVQMPDDLAAAGAKVNISFDNPNRTYGDDVYVYLPKGISISWQLRVSGFTGGDHTHEVDCDPLVVTSADYCKMQIQMPDDLAAAGAKVNISFDNPNWTYGDDAYVYLPKGISISWQLKVSGFTGGNHTHAVDCDPLVVTSADYCKMQIQMTDDLAAAGAKVNIAHDNPNKDYGDDAYVYLPKAINVTWQLKVSGFTGGSHTHAVDCDPLVVTSADYCKMQIQMPDDLAAAGAKVNISYDNPNKDYGDDAYVYLPRGISISWQLKVSGFTGGNHTYAVDCDPLVVTGADYCKMGFQIPDGAKVNIAHDNPNRQYADGDSVYLPICTDIRWQIYMDGSWSAYDTKHVDCSDLVYSPPG